VFGFGRLLTALGCKERKDMRLFGNQENGAEETRVAKPRKPSGGGSNLGTKLLSPFRSLQTFLRDVKLEMMRVVWPSKDETYTYTVVTVVAVVIVAAWVGVWDALMTNIVRMLNLYH
jgi:preprotein translocase subunit SecE